MIQVKCFPVNPIQENCYVVNDETGEAVIIDCGAYYDFERQAVTQHIKNNNLKPVHLLCTHGHFDHVLGNDTIFAEFGLKPEIHADDAPFIADVAKQCRDLGTGMSYDHPTPPVGQLLADGDIISFGTHHLQVIATPGHSQGGICFYCPEEKVIFTGDTLFRMSVGRTDLPGGSWEQLMESIRHLTTTIPSNVKVYPGHGPETTMAIEMSANPYLR